MNWQVLTRRPQPEDYEPGAGRVSRLAHICEEGNFASLCSVACADEEVFGVEPDLHPEDVDTLDQCSVCWSVFERRRREESGREAAPSNRLGAHARRPRTLADVLGAM